MPLKVYFFVEIKKKKDKEIKETEIRCLRCLRINIILYEPSK